MRSTRCLLAGLGLVCMLGMTSLKPTGPNTTPSYMSIGVLPQGLASVDRAPGMTPIGLIGEYTRSTTTGDMPVGYRGSSGARSIPAVFNGSADFASNAYGYYAMLTGGLFPTCQADAGYNGNNASGGTLRFIHDDPAGGYPRRVSGLAAR